MYSYHALTSFSVIGIVLYALLDAQYVARVSYTYRCGLSSLVVTQPSTSHQLAFVRVFVLLCQVFNTVVHLNW